MFWEANSHHQNPSLYKLWVQCFLGSLRRTRATCDWLTVVFNTINQSYFTLVHLNEQSLQPFSLEFLKVDGIQGNNQPFTNSACPPKRSQKSLRPKLVPIPLNMSEVGNSYWFLTAVSRKKPFRFLRSEEKATSLNHLLLISRLKTIEEQVLLLITSLTLVTHV